MQTKFIKEVVVIVVGKQAENIVDLLVGKNNVNEFLIAKKLNLTINQTRNILYKLSDYGLVSSIRKKDKKKGWYTYFWKIEVLKSLEFLKNVLKKKIDEVNHQIKSRETKLFYVCKRCNIELSEENALLHNFTCNECGDVFTLKDNSRILKELKKTLNKLEAELRDVEQEIEKEKEKQEKRKLKGLKKESAKKIKKKKSKKKVKNKKSKSKKKITKSSKQKSKKKSTKKIAKKSKKTSKKKLTKKTKKK